MARRSVPRRWRRLLGDEMDMTLGPSACPSATNNAKTALPNDGRARYANYGKGVAIWNTDAQAACWVNQQDITSVDMYWHTDPNEDAVCRTTLPGVTGGRWNGRGCSTAWTARSRRNGTSSRSRARGTSAAVRTLWLRSRRTRFEGRCGIPHRRGCARDHLLPACLRGPVHNSPRPQTNRHRLLRRDHRHGRVGQRADQVAPPRCSTRLS